jgi:large conductance mechanosensitive channel
VCYYYFEKQKLIKMLKEFRNFIMTGNVIEFAIAVILAGAVGLVVNGFVNDVMMPLIGYFAGGMDFADLKYVLEPASTGTDGVEVAEVAIRWGAWVNTIFNLIIVGFVLFMMSRAYNKSKKKEEVAAPAGPTAEDLLTEIRDALKK